MVCRDKAPGSGSGAFCHQGMRPQKEDVLKRKAITEGSIYMPGAICNEFVIQIIEAKMQLLVSLASQE